ncbi:hypothetical protein HaLaN_12570 [Haematococcus lacustris]|uniref:Uncharacterized protein n=1 Tax=Haematococcus lacustris TaxID=44745 RepID=A0A699Z3M4_HAELA|nr:hypothetical protein HaLaN_12570 [Haematococcus lacustris]
MYLSLVATDIYFQLTRQHKLLQGAMLMDMAHFMAVYLGLLVLTAMYTMLSDPTGEILFKAMLAPEVLSSLSWAEVALGISLRYLVPLLLHFTLVAGFFLAIILNPYSRLRMLASKDPGVPQDVSRMWRWQLQRMGPAKAPPNNHIDKIIDLCLLLQPVGLIERLRSVMVMSRSNMRSFMQGSGSTPAPQALLSSLPQHGTLRLDSLNLQMPSWSGASFMRNSTDPLHDQLASLRAGSCRPEHLPSVVSDEWQLSEDSCDPIPAGNLTPGNASLSSNVARPTKSAGGALPPVDTVGWLGSRTAVTPSASIFVKRHASLTDLGPRLKSATDRPLTAPYNTEGIMVARTASVTTVPSLFQRRTAFAHSTKVHPVLGPRYGAGDDSLTAPSGSMAAWPANPSFSADLKPALLQQPSLSVAAQQQGASTVAKDQPPPPPQPSMPPTSGTFALKDHEPSSKQLAQGPGEDQAHHDEAGKEHTPLLPHFDLDSGNTPSNDVKLPAFAVKKRVARRNISFLMDSVDTVATAAYRSPEPSPAEGVGSAASIAALRNSCCHARLRSLSSSPLLWL